MASPAPDGQADGPLAQHHEYADALIPHLATGEPEPHDSRSALEVMATAGAVLAAFAAGTLEVADHGPESTAAGEHRPQHHEDGARPGSSADPAAVPVRIDLASRARRRAVVGVLSLVSLGASGLATWRAYDDRTTFDIGIGVALAILAGILWAVRGRTAVTQLSVIGGRLEIIRSGTRMVFDLDDPHTALQVLGTPGERGWRVVFPRRTLSPVVIDASMVDPRDFTRVLELHRGLVGGDRSVRDVPQDVPNHHSVTPAGVRRAHQRR